MRPVLREGRASYILPFRDPISGKGRTVSLATTEENVAVAITTDIEALCTAKDILQAPRQHLDRLRTYERRAVEIIFGDGVAQEAFGAGAAIGLEKEDINTILEKVENSETLSKLSRRDEGIEWTAEEQRDWIEEELRNLTPAGYRRLKTSLANAVKELEELRRKNHYLQSELTKYRKEANFAVTVTLGKAIRGPAATTDGKRRLKWRNPDPQGFEARFKVGRSARQFRHVGNWLWKFAEWLPAKDETKIAEITAKHIDQWLTSFGNLNPRTRRSRRNVLSVFWRWATKEYGLGRNPMADADDIVGVVREEIRAIETYNDLVGFLDALKPLPYWRAYAAFACLCGPRKSEQFRLGLDDVINLDLVIIRATKTGRQRKVTIEKTILKPILEEHIACRRQERLVGSTPAGRSEYLFPTVLPKGPRDRSISAPGMWTSGFYGAWKAAKKSLKDKHGLTLDEYYWKYGPDEWRHTFGTTLAHCGWSSLEIARAMGNSPRVAEEHYIAHTSQGADSRWPLKF